MSDSTGELDRLLDRLERRSPSASTARLVGVGWGTVDIERTVTDLVRILARPTDDDVLLGARAWRADVGDVVLLLLEPNTEGRLAAALARRGEGIVASYVDVEGPLEGVLRPTALGLPGRVVPGDQPWGPFVIQVSSSAPGGSSMPAPGAHPASGHE